MPHPPIRRLLRQDLHPALQLHQSARHLARIEARRDRIAHDPPRTQLHGQVIAQMYGRRFGGRVAVRGVLAEVSDTDPRDGGRDDDAGGVGDGAAFREQRREFLDRVEDGFYVQVHDLAKGGVRVGFEGRTPGGAGVGEEDVDVVGVFRDEGGESLDFGYFGEVSGDGDGFCAGALVGEGVEGCDGFVAGFGFARGDVDLGAAGLHQARRTRVSGGVDESCGIGGVYPLAAWSPSPLLPPVTTATLPVRSKIEPKFSSLTSTSADMMELIEAVLYVGCGGGERSWGVLKA